MKKISRILSIFALIAALTVFAAACGKQEAETPAVSQADSDDWMDEAEASEDEYFDIADMEDEDVDYSKYEEKTTSTRAQNDAVSGATPTDEYGTAPVPEGRQEPVEPEDVEVDTSQKKTCYLTISCATILDNMENLTEGKEDLVPSDGRILNRKKVTFYEGESVFDILKRVTKDNKIHLEFVNTPAYNSAYIEGINNLYEFDCGSGSGWMYNVNGWYPNYGCSRYAVQQGDEIEWNYTCDLGADLGTSWMD